MFRAFRIFGIEGFTLTGVPPPPPLLQTPDPAVLRRVGEVMGLAGGKVRLRWASGAEELVRPQVRVHTLNPRVLGGRVVTSKAGIYAIVFHNTLRGQGMHANRCMCPGSAHTHAQPVS